MRSKSFLLLVVGPAAAFFLLQCGGAPQAPEHISAAEGFEVELAAGTPLVERPMIIDSDEQGRLYVAESSGSNDPVREQLANPTHSILRLEDVDGDGRYDRRTVFADKVMFPEGVLWADGSVYVAAPPSIWKFTDTDDDGRADKREEWFNGQTLTNCANDLHGPYLGPDGWIYWCKGAFAEQVHEQPGRSPLVTRAAHVFRRRPEGGPIESVLTGGMDNPVEVAFSPEGERFLTSTFLEHPQLGRRDGLIHALYGGVYGKVHGVTDRHPQTGGYQQAMAHLGPAAPVGLVYYASGGFGEEYRGNLFSTLFNLHKVMRHELEPVGATFKTKDSDLLVSESVDFHPTDVMEDADGSLLVVDTGGWYKLCCPTSQLAKPDVLGAIYRIRRKGATPIADPRGLAIDWAAMDSNEAASLLGDARPAVARRAGETLSKQGGRALEALGVTLATSESVDARRNGVWALTRIAGDEARALARKALEDAEVSVRHAAIHSASVRRDADALPRLLEFLAEGPAPLARAAAEAVGRLGEPAAVGALLNATGRADDEALRHSLTFALIEIGDADKVRAGLRAAAPQTRRAALIALDQMTPGKLAARDVVPLLSSAEPLLNETATWIVGHHPDWGAELGGYFRKRLVDNGLDSNQREELAELLARLAGNEAVQELLANTLRSTRSAAARTTALIAMERAAVEQAPESWISSLHARLAGLSGKVLEQAVRTARAVPAPAYGTAKEALQTALARVGTDRSQSAIARATALAAAAEGLTELPQESFEFLVAQLDPEQEVPLRGAAAEALGGIPLSLEQLTTLLDAVREAGPLELPQLTAAYEGGGDAELGEALLAALADAPGAANLRPDLIEKAFEQYPESVRAGAAALLAERDIDRSAQRERLETMLDSMRDGDVRRGQAVFNSSKAACSSCHRIGYLGGRVGPDLTRIGEIREQRDLLEALLYPSASFVRSYEPVVAVTADDVHSGVAIDENDDFLLLATGVDTQVRLARAAIEEVRPGAVSIMPAGLEEQFSTQELADLLAFLENTRRGP